MSSLESFFAPKRVAVIGATKSAGSVGRTVMENFVAGKLGGPVYPVNPKRSTILGIPAYVSIVSTPLPADLAVIATPAATVPDVISQCGAAGVKCAVVLSAGFSEMGVEGEKLAHQIAERAHQAGMRVIGPNCLGVMNPCSGLNATFADAMALPGSVAFVSQSGALCTAILDWSLKEQVGFSAFISLGSMVDVGWGDMIDYLANDPHTKSILLYMESVGDARQFLSAAREAALSKPILVLKAGRTAAGARAAASHTGTLAGSDAVLDAAFRRAGVLRVATIAELFYMAGVLAKQPRPKGSRLTILTNAGGPGVLAADSLIAEGGSLAELSPQTMDALNEVLPPQWSRNNPVDVLGDAGPERYATAAHIASVDPNSDGLLVILTPQAMTEPTEIAELVSETARDHAKPVLASWMGGESTADGVGILQSHEIPVFPYPDTAARIFAQMWRYTENIRSLYETPTLGPGRDGDPEEHSAPVSILAAARAAGRTILTEYESKRFISAYGIPTVTTKIATTEDEAASCADLIGYPVVVKLYSETITHKTDVDGVHLRLADADSVRAAFRATLAGVTKAAGAEHFQGVTVQPMVAREGYELIVGSTIDPQFGPVLLFGTGGQMVEVYADSAIGLPPLNTTLALRLIERTRIYRALQGVRGREPADMAALEQTLVRFSRLVIEQPRIAEIDINPLLAGPDSVLALDARVILHPWSTDDADLPKPAIRPYPAEYSDTMTLADGVEVSLRPIRPEDEPLMVKFHGMLSPQSVHMRYFSMVQLSQRVAHDRLARICFLDYDRQIAIVAVVRNAKTGDDQIAGVGRLIRRPGTDEAEFALLIADPYQCRGIGTKLLKLLQDIGRREKIKMLAADILPENERMRRLCASVGFDVEVSADGDVRASMTLE